MKRKITLLLCLAALMALLVGSVQAAGSVEASLTADQTTVNAGDTVTVTLTATVDACDQGGVEVSYDSEVMELVSGQWNLSNTMLTDFNTATKDGVFAFDSASAVSGNILTLTLKVRDSAVGSGTVSVTFFADSTTVTKTVTVNIACDHTYDNDCDTTCNICGATRTVTHQWDGGAVTQEATCTAEGVKTYTCTVCGVTKTEAVAVKDHAYDSGTVTVAATCTEDGVKTYTCADCGATRTETVECAGHSYDSGKVTTEATCTAEGVKTYTCTVCGKEKTETISKKSHTYDEGTVIAEVTCTQDGSVVYTCSACGGTYTGTVAAEGHVYDHDCDPDCNVCGELRAVEHLYNTRWSYDETGHWHECTICGDVLELLPHTPGPDPTEDEDQICLDCGFVLQPAGTHVHSGTGDWLSDGDGHWHLCACGEVLDQADHIWNEGITDGDAGVITYTCTVCGHIRTEEVATEPVETEPATQPDTETQPEEADPEPTEEPEEPGEDSGFPWWIVILAVCLVLLGGVIFVIVGILRSRKVTGKYSA